MSAESLARPVTPGIELLPRTPATERGTARRRGSRRWSASLLEEHRGSWVTRPPGPATMGVSTGSVTGTGHPKGPCDSYSQGPFVHFRYPVLIGPGGDSDPARSPIPAQLWGSERFLWTTGTRSVDEPPISGGTGRMLAKGLARRVTQGIELLPRTPARERGTARRRGSTRSGTGLPGKLRGGEVTASVGAGVNEQSTGSVTGTGHTEGPLELILPRALHLFPGPLSAAEATNPRAPVSRTGG
jgi:hypothetical protein